MTAITAADLDAIIEGEGTKASKARALYALDPEITRNDVVALLGMNYSQAHSIYKEMGNPTQARQPRVGGRSERAQASASRKVTNRMRFSPTQVRYVTQDGHEIYRVDDEAGRPICRGCRAELTYSISSLSFVHTYSSAPITAMVDHYPGNPEDEIDIRLQ